MRERYAYLLNEFPLVIPAAMFLAAFGLLAPVAGEYAAVLAILIAARLTRVW